VGYFGRERYRQVPQTQSLGLDSFLYSVAALGITVTGISLSTKKVTLRGFNGLKDGVIIQAFDLPANDPAGGIHLTLQTTVTNVRLLFCSLSIAFPYMSYLVAFASWRLPAKHRV
jgi:hypothetical protein